MRKVNAQGSTLRIVIPRFLSQGLKVAGCNFLDNQITMSDIVILFDCWALNVRHLSAWLAFADGIDKKRGGGIIENDSVVVGMGLRYWSF